MRKLLRILLFKPIQWVVDRFTSEPDRDRVFEALSKLSERIITSGGKKGFTIPFDLQKGNFIIFSDQHKGRRNGADDFALAEKNYIAALNYYSEKQFHFISLGDSEELWENTLLQVKKHNQRSFEAEKLFVQRNAFTKIFGNHDLDWEIDPLAPVYLKEIYGSDVVALEAIMLETKIENDVLRIFCTHGHQGDLQSDGNWLSKFIVAKIWAPLQAYLEIKPATPSYDRHLKTLHNEMMYQWASHQHKQILITGHTHQPVFESMTQVEKLEKEHAEALRDLNPEWAAAIETELSWRRNVLGETTDGSSSKFRPCYFNSGCCSFPNGDISGLEISDGKIRLIKWEGDTSVRRVLEEKDLILIFSQLKS